MNLSNKLIKEAAEFLEMGMICYINKETNQIISIPNPDGVYFDEELWIEDLNKIENNADKYISLEPMSSRDAFRMMEDFVMQVPDIKIRNRLIYALNKNKPFKNFRYEVDYHEEIRQQWFKFKAYRYEEYVRELLEFLSRKEREND